MTCKLKKPLIECNRKIMTLPQYAETDTGKACHGMCPGMLGRLSYFTNSNAGGRPARQADKPLPLLWCREWAGTHLRKLWRIPKGKF